MRFDFQRHDGEETHCKKHHSTSYKITSLKKHLKCILSNPYYCNFRPNGYVTSVAHPDAYVLVVERGHVGPADVSHVAAHLGDDRRRVHAVTPSSRRASTSGPRVLVRIRVRAGFAASTAADLIVHTQRILERSSQSEFSANDRQRLRGLLQLQSILIYFKDMFLNCFVSRSYKKDSTTKMPL